MANQNRRNTTGNKQNSRPPPVHVKSPSEYEMANSPTIAGTPPNKFLAPGISRSGNSSSGSRSSSSRLSLDFSPDKLEGKSMRRRMLYDNSDISGEEQGEDADVLSWKVNLEKATQPEGGLNSTLTSGNEFLTPLSTSSNDHWKLAYKIASKYDKILLENWKDELEKCLIIVGLFVAASGGFAVQYLCFFQGPQAAIFKLFHSNAGFVGGSFQPFTLSVPISILWVLSLVVALGAVVVGITCLQWIREYLNDSRLGPKQSLAFRQMRYDGLMFWKVPFIISILPILLQISLMLFLHGLLQFLYLLDNAVANAVAVPIGLLWAFMILATILPALQCIFLSQERVKGNQCPSKSPQARLFAWVAFRISILAIRGVRVVWDAEFLKKKQVFLEKLVCGGLDWVSFDTVWHQERSQEHDGYDIAPALAWLARKGIHNDEGIHALHCSFREVHPATALEILRRLVPEDHVSQFTLQCSHNHHHDEVLKDVMSAVLLGYLVRNNHQLQAPFLHHRVELFIRIANSLAGGNTGEELKEDTRALVEKYLEGAETTIMPFTVDQDYAKLPNGYKHQLLMTFNTHLKAKAVTLQPLPRILWEIVRPMVAQIITGYPSIASNQDLQAALNAFNKELEAYFIRISASPNKRDKFGLVSATTTHLLHYVNQFFTRDEPAQFWVESTFPEFWEGLKTLRNVAKLPTSPRISSHYSNVSRTQTLVAEPTVIQK